MKYNHLSVVEPLEIKTTESRNGRFYHVPSGNAYPSITTVLGAKEKPALVDWRNSLGPARADKEMKRCADRGSAVHLMVERHIQNDPNPTTDQHIDHINEYKSLRLLLSRIDNILLQESALYSDILKVAGRVDCVAEFDGVMSVIDFKTSTNSKTTHMIEDYYLQTTAYALMVEEMYDIQIEDIVIIMSVEKGMPMVFKRKIAPYITPLCVRINNYHKEHK